MRSLALSVVAVAITAAAIPADAQDRNGFQAIATGDMAAAERTLVAERRIFPDRPELMLNLAAVYARTGRADAARSLYAAVMARPAVAMDLPDGTTRSSHLLAGSGMNRLSPLASAR